MLKDWKPVDVIVGSLTILVCVGLSTGILGSMIVQVNGGEFNAERSKTLMSAFTAITNMISMFIGAKLQEKLSEKKLNNSDNGDT